MFSSLEYYIMGQLYFYSIYDIRSAICTDRKHDVVLTSNRSGKFRIAQNSLNVSDQVSHPYRTTGNIIVLYILIFNILDSKLEDK